MSEDERVLVKLVNIPSTPINLFKPNMTQKTAFSAFLPFSSSFVTLDILLSVMFQ